MTARLRVCFAALVAADLGGCVTREFQTWRVITNGDCRPVAGVKVTVQPWAPIHPFWPAADSGTTDRNGEVRLSLPQDFWFTWPFVRGYHVVNQPTRFVPVPPMVNYDIYVQR